MCVNHAVKNQIKEKIEKEEGKKQLYANLYFMALRFELFMLYYYSFGSNLEGGAERYEK